MGSFGIGHWILIAVLVLLLFGGNRFSAMMGDVAKGLKSFKKGMSEEDEDKPRQQDPRQLPPQQPIDVTPRPSEPVSPPPPPSDDANR